MSERLERARLGAVLVAIVLATLTLGAATAHAGQWIQVSCQNPDGSSSNGQGWTGVNAGTGGSITSTSCAAGSPMVAELLGSQPDPSTETLTYTPPSGSTLAGGTVNTYLYGASDAAISLLFSPSDTDPPIAFCAENQNCPPVRTTVTLPSNEGGNIVAQANCSSQDTSGGCTEASDGTTAVVDIYWADLLLDNAATPGISGTASGTALGTVSGTGQLLFTATDPNGPGVYNVTAAIDGTTIYSATPNTNSGACVPVGKQGGVLMFDAAQPCPTTASVDVPVPTANVANGTHTLTATVTDAAGNSTTVFAQPITVDNPVAPAPAPTAPSALKKIRDKAVFAWDYRKPVTRLTSVRLGKNAHLPAGARVSVACEPAKLCPRKLPTKSIGVKKLAKLFDALKDTHFRVGAVFQLTISAPHRKAERLVYTMRSRKLPAGRVRYGVKLLPKHPVTAVGKHKPTASKKKTTKKSAGQARRR